MASKDETHVDLLSKDLQNILNIYPTFTHEKEREKIRCQLSGHEMPCIPETVNSYIQGKKFQKLLGRYSFDYDKYKQHIVASTKKGRQHQLFCLLTLRHVNNAPLNIQRHVEGRRFLKAHKRWEECQSTGQEFVPQAGKKRKQTMDKEVMSDTEAVNSDGEESVDSLSDLYPAADFMDEDSEKEEDKNEENEHKDDGNGGEVDSDFDPDDLRTSEDTTKPDTSKSVTQEKPSKKRKHTKEKSSTEQKKKNKRDICIK